MKKEVLTRTQVLLEPAQLKALAQIAGEQGKSVSALLREWVGRGLLAHQKEVLSKAAHSLVDVYYSDGELVGYSSLDGDDFWLKGQG